MRITFLGGGNMAAALIGGLIERGFAREALQAVDLSPDARTALSDRFGVRAVESLDEAALECDVLVLAVKPQHMRDALAPLAGRLGSQLVLSIAAGIRMEALSRWLGGYRRIVRAMPNTPALIGAGAAGLIADNDVTDGDRDAASSILGAVGSVVWLTDETQIDAVTALSGSGPAYVFYFIEALIEGGEALGLPRDTARTLAIDTVLGAARLAAASDEDAATLRARVTSKGGTTAAALGAMEEAGFKALIARALVAAETRGRAMGEELGRD
ncbi:pyrroline-5-carboxylate reductase [Niveibacterium sp. 24ML]|uniref:pyrroline-5-carboxylate reductase n=1 Tax=Niveibacterium sp. 24ML TaxID=2985512 RepID=UPI002271995F|nr:pyrroline-5-carboxylate reductase [Niveibacterium sp. 24ML]MCX9157429.1 pyrroline-5-carboxylate reductase [Niveibacterium sp. 24ML]